MFVEKNPDLDLTGLTFQDYERIFHNSVQQYESVMSMNTPDLSEFRDTGGKMITWHGIDDLLIYVNGSRQYSEAVQALDPGVRDYHRCFEAPGVMHYLHDKGFFPNSSFAALVDWVEKGVEPEALEGIRSSVDEGDKSKRPVCNYPLVARYVGGDPSKSEWFDCAKSFV